MLGCFPDIQDISPNAFSPIETFPENLFPSRQDAFRFSQVNDKVSMFHSVSHSVDQFSFSIDVFVINQVYFRFADFLYDHLLGELGSSASVIFLNLLD